MTKDLIIVCAGKRSLHPTWLDRDTPRSWDLLISPYQDIPDPSAGIEGVLVAEVIRAPAKIAGFKILLNDWQGWRDYRYILLVDDDLFAPQSTWSRFFERCAQFDAKLAQPGLMEGSFFSHTVTACNAEYAARRVSFVEIMMPCFRSDVLAEMLGTLDLGASGFDWGLDFLWAKMLGYRDIFVIDETPVLHTRPVGVNRNPEQHRKFQSEHAKFMRDHKLPWLLKTFAGLDASGIEVAENNPAFLYRLFRGFDLLFKKQPERFDELIRLQLAAAPKVS